MADFEVRKLLIANRGEIALRIAQTAGAYGREASPAAGPGTGAGPRVRFHTVALYTSGERDALHVHACDSAVELVVPAGASPSAAYLDAQQIVRIAQEQRCWAIIPGYGFLSESPAFAKAIEDAAAAAASSASGEGPVWIGPTSAQLALLGDKLGAKRLAAECGVPLLPGTPFGEGASLAQVAAFVRALPRGAKAILKAVAGGGGRGMRVVPAGDDEAALRQAYDACAREAQAAFGDARNYAERYLEGAKHIEVQIVGDGSGDVAHLWDRECSVQRRHQKLVEIAPAPALRKEARDRILQYAVAMAEKVKYKSLGTWEFLFLPATEEAFLLEVNPRIQVEHTVTEQVTGLDLVSLQLSIALGATLRSLGLYSNLYTPLPLPSVTAIQVRLNAERFQPDGSAHPAPAAELAVFRPPTALGPSTVVGSSTSTRATLARPQYRLDTAAHAPLLLPDPAARSAGGASGKRRLVAYRVHPSFDSLLAKLIVTAPSYGAALAAAAQGLADFQVHFAGGGGAGTQTEDGTNRNLLRVLLDREEMRRDDGRAMSTGFVQEHAAELYAAAKALSDAEGVESGGSSTGRPGAAQSGAQAADQPEGTEALAAPMSGVVASLSVKEGDAIAPGQAIAELEAMKMIHLVRADRHGTVARLAARAGDVLNASDPVLFFKPSDAADGAADAAAAAAAEEASVDLDEIRPELQSVLARKKFLQDEGREQAVAKRHALGMRTARENLHQLVDKDSFIELGDLTIAAQLGRRTFQDLAERTAGDGVIIGWATVNARRAGVYPSPWRCAICICDYLVLAATQGHNHHIKLDRLYNAVLNNPAPLVLYAEGGGGRPGDIGAMKVGGLDTPSFALLASIRASGILSIGVANGYVFAGNAALLGTCDIIIATTGGGNEQAQRDGKARTSIGMAGPAMISGGGLGDFAPQDVGPVSIHLKNGGIDLLVPTEVEATAATKRLLSYFQPVPPHLADEPAAAHADQRLLRHALPRDRKRAYDVKNVIRTLVDEDSYFEMGASWGQSLITALVRIDGQPLGLVASSVLSPLGGAVDAASALKATRFTQLLTRTKALHLVVICDTPGFMVGPDAEKEGGLRAFADWFASLRSFEMSGGRIFSVTLRKAYGLGAQALCGGSTIANFFSVSWPTGEFAGMGIEGAVRLGMRKELEAVKDPKAREQLFEKFVAEQYERGKAESAATVLEIDTVIDPADTRDWIKRGLASVPARTPVWLEPPSRNNSARL